MSFSPIKEISSKPENVHFASGNPEATDGQFAAKWTPKKYLMYHSMEQDLDKAGAAADRAQLAWESGGPK